MSPGQSTALLSLLSHSTATSITYRQLCLSLVSFCKKQSNVRLPGPRWWPPDEYSIISHTSSVLKPSVPGWKKSNTWQLPIPLERLEFMKWKKEALADDKSVVKHFSRPRTRVDLSLLRIERREWKWNWHITLCLFRASGYSCFIVIYHWVAI